MYNTVPVFEHGDPMLAGACTRTQTAGLESLGALMADRFSVHNRSAKHFSSIKRSKSHGDLMNQSFNRGDLGIAFTAGCCLDTNLVSNDTTSGNKHITASFSCLELARNFSDIFYCSQAVQSVQQVAQTEGPFLATDRATVLSWHKSNIATATHRCIDANSSCEQALRVSFSHHDAAEHVTLSYIQSGQQSNIGNSFPTSFMLRR